MSKFKVSLVNRLPDFKLPVKFVMPNGEEAEIVFTVKHKTALEIKAMYDSEQKTTDEDFIGQLVSGWDLEEEFNKENANILIDMFPAVAMELTRTYLGALAGYRVKN